MTQEREPEPGVAAADSAASLALRFQRDGFLALRSLFTPSEVHDIVGRLDEFLVTVLEHIPPEHVFFENREDPASLKQIQLLHQHAPFIDDLACQGKLPKLAATLLGEACEIQNVQLFRKAPGHGRATPPHQDGEYFKLDPPQAVTLWLALDPTDSRNGCLRYVRGSHCEGLRPHTRGQTLGFSQRLTDWTSQDVQREVAIPAGPGDLIAHHAMTIHRADGNRHGPIRRALGFIYYGHSAREDEDARRQARDVTYSRWRAEGRIPPSEPKNPPSH